MSRKDVSNKIIVCTATIAFLFALIVSITEFLCLNVPDWFRYEYDKQNSVDYVNGDISLDDCVYVSNQTMYYCFGKRNSLEDVKATIDGEEVNFFTNREISHLKDCRTLIGGLLVMRNLACGVLLACIILLSVLKAQKRTVARMYLVTAITVLCLAAVVAIIACINFDAVFVKFHELVFNNDNWLMNPYEDELVNIMREGMFADTAALIAGLWFVIACVPGAVAIRYLKGQRH